MHIDFIANANQMANNLTGVQKSVHSSSVSFLYYLPICKKYKQHEWHAVQAARSIHMYRKYYLPGVLMRGLRSNCTFLSRKPPREKQGKQVQNLVSFELYGINKKTTGKMWCTVSGTAVFGLNAHFV